MNPFNQPSAPRSAWARWLARPELIVFGVCLAAGLALVGWRAVLSSRAAHALARAEVQARAAALEAQLNQVPTAAELLGAMARQGRAGFPDFQKAAAEVLHQHPGLTSLELQPAGLVTEVVPREGNELVLGVNVLRDPNLSAGANEAIARRALTVSGPVKLPRGEQGLVARVPLYQRTPDGRESFWGFVAVSMRVSGALTWTEVDRLPRRGYGFALFVPPSTRQKGLTVAATALASLQGAEQQSVRVQDLEFRLAVMPRAGWVDKAELAVEAALAVLFAAVAALLAWFWGSCRMLEAELAQATNRLAQEQARRAEAEAAQTETRDHLASVQAELESAQFGVKQAATRVAELENELQANAHKREEALQVQVAKQNETQAALAKAQETIAQLQVRHEAAAQAEKNNAAAAEERVRHHQTALSELRAKLEAATRSAREEAKAKAMELALLAEENRELKTRVAAAEQVEARVTELEALLEEAQESLKQRVTVPTEETEAPASEAAPEEEFLAGEETSSENVFPEADAEPAEVAAESVPVEIPEELLDSPPEQPDVSSEPEPTPVVAEPPALEATEAEPASLAEPATSPAQVEAPAEPAEAPKPAPKPPRRRKSSRDDQMDLFGGDSSAAQADRKVPSKAAERAAESKESPAAENATPSRRLPPAPPMDEAEFRQAVHLIVPLLVDQDPGAKDCLRDNRNTFRSGFTPEAYVEFEQSVKRGDFAPALEDLKKAARKHGVSI